MLFFIHLLLFVAVVNSNEEYKGHKVYRLDVENQLQQDGLLGLKSDVIDYWVRPSFKYGVSGLAMVPLSQSYWFEKRLAELKIAKKVHIEDVYEYLLEQLNKKYRRKRSTKDNELNKVGENDDDSENIVHSRDGGDDEDNEIDEDGENDDDGDDFEIDESSEEEDVVEPFDMNRFNRYQSILNHLRTLANQYNTPESRLELIEYGQTDEGRPLFYLKITHRNTQLPTVLRPVIVIEAGIIPREWITISSVLYILERLLAEQSYLQAFDWILIPVVNPDGYEYSHTNLRLWMKTRSTKSNLGHICPGANINRNFDVDWLNFEASSSPCSHLYGGIAPFSEIETQMIQSIISEYGSRTRLYLSLQNNGGYITYPWNYERAASGMFRQHHLLGIKMVNSARETYKLDVGSTIFDRASGTSSDYARMNNILYTYNIDIVQRDGFIIPEEEIGVISEDVWQIVTTAARELSD